MVDSTATPRVSTLAAVGVGPALPLRPGFPPDAAHPQLVAHRQGQDREDPGGEESGGGEFGIHLGGRVQTRFAHREIGCAFP